MAAVLDASALIAMLLDETGGSLVAAELRSGQMAAPNLAEVAGHFARLGATPDEVTSILDGLPVEVVPADRDVSIAAGLLRSRTMAVGLSRGDRYCLALAQRTGLVALTADRAWLTVASDIGIDVRLIR